MGWLYFNTGSREFTVLQHYALYCCVLLKLSAINILVRFSTKMFFYLLSHFYFLDKAYFRLSDFEI